MFNNRSFLFNSRSERSSALIITLAALVLISTILLLFFDMGTLNRQISFSSAGQYRADLLAQSAIDTTIGDLRTEITAGSAAPLALNANTNLYLPLTTSPPNTMLVPFRVDDQGFSNLVAQSAASSNFWTGASYDASVPNPIRSASGNNTQTASLNGRFISINRWNKAGLLGDPGVGAVPAIPASYIPPDWVVVTRQGPITNAATSMPSVKTMADRTTTNLSYAVGRYAYTVYDEGGLLDANVAGMPGPLTSTSFASERGLLPQVDLANLLSTAAIGDGNAAADANALVQWRNPATAASATTYTNYVATTTNGFTQVGYTSAAADQALTGRQDLVNYIKSNSIPTAALSFLGTFSLDSDQPSYYPDPNRPKASTTQDDITNPNVLKILVQNSFNRASDNTVAVVGESLLKHRFPLSRLALFQNPTGTTNGISNAILIKEFFAMQSRSDGLWDYVDPDTGIPATVLPTIKTLALVAAASPGREPTFWELLQAAILTGSLGTNMSSNSAGLGCDTTPDQSATRQIFTIGLSILDQYDTDGDPTVLNFGGMAAAKTSDWLVAGIGNLPYILWMAHEYFQDNQPETPSPPPGFSYVDGYLLFALWNPHRNASTASPGTFRIIANGQTAVDAYYYTKPGSTIATGPLTGSVTHSYGTTSIPFHTTANRNFQAIDVLRASDLSGHPSSDGGFPASTATPKQVGLLIGQVSCPTSSAAFDSISDMNYTYPASGGIPGVTLVVEKQVGANWIPYQVIPYYQLNCGYDGSNFYNISVIMNSGNFYQNNTSTTLSMVLNSAHSDPRTVRFGFGEGSEGYNKIPSQMAVGSFKLILSGKTLTPYIALISSPFYSTASALALYPLPSFALADYAYNQTADPYSYYQDPDGVVRQGDSNPADPSKQLNDSPYGYSSVPSFTPSDAQPIILNRAFTSVAEMGYAFRDDPWRTLNFSSKDSADGGLLDLFCLNENDNATRAGVVDINNASTEVLTALLMNAYRDPYVPTTATSAATSVSPNDTPPFTALEAATIAQAIRTALGPAHAPLMVIRNVSDLPLLISSIAAFLPDTFKYKREAVTRALADVMNTRTWNLMIDVISQSGRYTARSQTLNDFVVEGERRYWIHVAIDRFTGKVLAQLVEPVSE
jgi:hypothetical protein